MNIVNEKYAIDDFLNYLQYDRTIPMPIGYYSKIGPISERYV